MRWERLEISEEQGIVTVTMNRPEKLNALDAQMFIELDRISRDLRKKRDMRGVILTGAGSDFSSGLDIKSFSRSVGMAIKILMKWLPGDANLAQRVSCNWRRLPVPVVAVIRGRCYGGGTQIALGADFRIVSPEAELSIMEVRWGLVPDMAGLLTLREVVAKDVALRLTMTGEIVQAREARELGLVTEIAEDPLARAQELLATIAERSPDAIAAIKGSTQQGWLDSARGLLSRETLSQLRLLAGKNLRIAFKKQTKDPNATYKPRQPLW